MPPQHYLEQVRQLKALSLTVHLPLVCFGIAFPSMVLFAESRYLRNGDRVYRTIAQRWSKVMLTLLPVGVVTGTILSFEFGVLWPNFIGRFGSVFGLGFALEGFSFFLEAIFIGIYVYGWDRLSLRRHFLSGVPVAIAGVTGSTFVIAVNAWMNHPSGFRIVHGRAVDVHPWAALFGNAFLWQELVHMYLAASEPTAGHNAQRAYKANQRHRPAAVMTVMSRGPVSSRKPIARCTLHWRHSCLSMQAAAR